MRKNINMRMSHRMVWTLPKHNDDADIGFVGFYLRRNESVRLKNEEKSGRANFIYAFPVTTKMHSLGAGYSTSMSVSEWKCG